MAVKILKSDEARQQWRNLLDDVGAGEDVVIERYTKPVAALISYENFIELQEKLDDLRAARQASATPYEIEADSDRVRPWTEVRAELEADGDDRWQPMMSLADIGFRKDGYWLFENGNLKVMIDAEGSTTNILYCFVVDGEPMYVGKTVQSLERRMYGYQNPGPTQNTNCRINRNLVDVLSNGSVVELYVLPDRGLIRFGRFHLNLAAGLEDSIVAILSPKWNVVGKNSLN